MSNRSRAEIKMNLKHAVTKLRTSGWEQARMYNNATGAHCALGLLVDDDEKFNDPHFKEYEWVMENRQEEIQLLSFCALRLAPQVELMEYGDRELPPIEQKMNSVWRFNDNVATCEQDIEQLYACALRNADDDIV